MNAPALKDGPMFVDERRRHVLALIEREGHVRISDLSVALGISRITIRKDLDHLEARRLLQRTHGGALSLQTASLAEWSLKEREDDLLKEEARIAEAAAAMVQDGQCVLLNAGTATTAVARALRGLSFLTIVTNAIHVVSELAGVNFDVILTGGLLRKGSCCLVGPLAEEPLQEIRGDILFLSVDGLDPTVGPTASGVPEARVSRAMVRAARKVVVVCDSSKLSHPGLALIAGSSTVHTVVTSIGISARNTRMLCDAGIEVLAV